MRVYIAGPYTKGDRSENVRNAMKAMDQLIAAGHEPFCPLLTHFQDLAFPRPWSDWMRIDLAWLPFAEAVVRLPGNSEGADTEVVEAERRGVPVFYGIQEFRLFLSNERGGI
ncbi:MAG TPA: DUF4406 domain-containing protein [Sedimentisphaerales bacterium]|nr:DUF4406 domain-containing protein [Sedimentisphaerales bacterium]